MTTEAPAWQRGYDLEYLRRIKGVFDAHDAGLILGAFTAVKERTIAGWLDEEMVQLDNLAAPSAVVVGRRAKAPSSVRDFTGAVRATIPEGATRVVRVACHPGAEDRLLAMLGGIPNVWIDLWTEHPADRSLASLLVCQPVAVKVRASSELVTVWTNAPIDVEPVSPADEVGIGRLNLPELDVAPLLVRLAADRPEYADHYSSYNLRRSWSAAALRSYGGDPAFIIKPSEMSKGWKAEHPEALGWEPADTPLRALLPEAEPLIAAIPHSRMERVRLMRLAPGKGELTRHADITDPDAGTGPGKLLRIHVPLVTNPGVVFTSWSIDGEKQQTHMEPGRAYYLDTRKPHAAVNAGDSERIHLVMDVESSPELLALL